MGRAALYVLSYNRPELLACCLAGLCGFNVAQPPSAVAHAQARAPAPQMPVHVIDDGSPDPRVMPLLARYKEAGLIEVNRSRPAWLAQSAGQGSAADD